MQRWAKVVAWTAVFAACASAGAWMASRTDPFPPGVDDPGARETERPSSSPEASLPAPVWAASFDVTSEHRLHVGGACRSDWRGTFRTELAPSGKVRSDGGVASLDADTAGCDFDQAQVQTDSVTLAVSGTWERVGSGVVLRLRLRATELNPVGSTDLGGFLATVEEVRPVLRAQLDPSDAEIGDGRKVIRPDGNEGTYVAEYDFIATCRSGCS